MQQILLLLAIGFFALFLLFCCAVSGAILAHFTTPAIGMTASVTLPFLCLHLVGRLFRSKPSEKAQKC
jgi:hypothetical protein